MKRSAKSKPELATADSASSSICSDGLPCRPLSTTPSELVRLLASFLHAAQVPCDSIQYRRRVTARLVRLARQKPVRILWPHLANDFKHVRSRALPSINDRIPSLRLNSRELFHRRPVSTASDMAHDLLYPLAHNQTYLSSKYFLSCEYLEHGETELSHANEA